MPPEPKIAESKTAEPKILIDSGPSEAGWHRIEDFIRCPTFYAYRKMLSEEGHLHRALVRGSIGHVGVAHHYARVRARQGGQDPDRFYKPEQAMERVAEKFGELGSEMLAIARPAALAYNRAHAAEPLKVLEVEEAHAAWVGWPPHLAALRPERRLVADEASGELVPRAYRLTARLDLVVEDPSGGIWIMDHKFVAKAEAKVFARYTNSGQFLAAQWFGHALWPERFVGVYVNLIVVGGARTRFVRATIGPSPHLLRKFPQLYCDAQERREDLETEGRDLWDYPAAAQEQVCVGPYGTCEFFTRCQWGRAESETAEVLCE